MLEAARLAHSGGNVQSHCFGVIDDPDLKMKLAAAAGEQMWIATAPIVIACCADISWDLANCSEDEFGLIVNKLRFSDELIQYLNKYNDRKYICSLFQNAVPLIPAMSGNKVQTPMQSLLENEAERDYLHISIRIPYASYTDSVHRLTSIHINKEGYIQLWKY